MSNSAEHHSVMGLGRQLRRLRDDRGLSLRALASEVDVTASFLSQVERGLSSPSLSTLRQLAAFFEVPVFQLLVEYEVNRAVVRADERVTISLPDSVMSYELLSSPTARAIEMFRRHGFRLAIYEPFEAEESCLPSDSHPNAAGHRRLLATLWPVVAETLAPE